MTQGKVPNDERTDCEVCDAGQFRGSTDTECKDCPAPEISRTPGSEACEACQLVILAAGFLVNVAILIVYLIGVSIVEGGVEIYCNDFPLVINRSDQIIDR